MTGQEFRHFSRPLKSKMFYPNRIILLVGRLRYQLLLNQLGSLFFFVSFIIDYCLVIRPSFYINKASKHTFFYFKIVLRTKVERNVTKVDFCVFMSGIRER